MAYQALLYKSGNIPSTQNIIPHQQVYFSTIIITAKAVLYTLYHLTVEQEISGFEVLNIHIFQNTITYFKIIKLFAFIETLYGSFCVLAAYPSSLELITGFDSLSCDMVES